MEKTKKTTEKPTEVRYWLDHDVMTIIKKHRRRLMHKNDSDLVTHQEALHDLLRNYTHIPGELPVSELAIAK